jgi:alkanesulfonate monooxygenase SsuD/methylene tetrahydromethanopterin reductase-like flavin-dependent oxidoreductase (luciferase family)
LTTPADDRIHFGFVTPQHWRAWDELVELWQFAEATGWDSAWLMDHFFSLSRGTETGPCLEGWTALAGLAATVPRLKLGLFVTGITHRNPAILFKQAATVDAISGGRLVLGLGAAWNAREHAAHGLEFPPPGERVDRFGEALAILRLLETHVKSTFHGRYYRVEEMPFAPKPVNGHVPVLIGSKGGRMLHHVARYADLWEGGTKPDEIRALGARVAELCIAIGRDPGEITPVLEAISTVVPDPLGSEAAFREHVRVYAAAGIRWFLFNIPDGPLTPVLRTISERVIPELRLAWDAGALV